MNIEPKWRAYMQELSRAGGNKSARTWARTWAQAHAITALLHRHGVRADVRAIQDLRDIINDLIGDY